MLFGPKSYYLLGIGTKLRHYSVHVNLYGYCSKLVMLHNHNLIDVGLFRQNYVKFTLLLYECSQTLVKLCQGKRIYIYIYIIICINALVIRDMNEGRRCF